MKSRGIQLPTTWPAGAALGAAFLLAAFNLRPAIVAVSPILSSIRHAYGLSPVAAGVLTSMPLVCFGAAALLAPRLVRRRGVGGVMLACLLVLVVGIALRSLPTLVALFAGTLVIGLSVGICNVLMPGVVKKDFPRQVALMTGLYTTMLELGPAAGAGLTVPLERAFGSWRLALGAWGVLVVVAVVCWLPFRRHDVPTEVIAEAPAAERRRLWRSGQAWSLSLYMGMGSLNFYTVLAWLPTILHRRGVSVLDAGTLLAVLNVVAIAASLLAPALSQRLGSQRVVAVGTAALNVAGTVGLIADGQHLQVLWVVCIGLGQGAAISLAFMMMVVKASSPNGATALSGMAQGVGYLLAAGGPVLAGALFNVSGGWDLPLEMVIALLCVQMIAVWWTDRPARGAGDAALATLGRGS